MFFLLRSLRENFNDLDAFWNCWSENEERDKKKREGMQQPNDAVTVSIHFLCTHKSQKNKLYKICINLFFKLPGDLDFEVKLTPWPVTSKEFKLMFFVDAPAAKW